MNRMQRACGMSWKWWNKPGNPPLPRTGRFKTLNISYYTKKLAILINVNYCDWVVYCILNRGWELSCYSNGLWAGQLSFDSWQGQDFSLLHSIQTRSQAHPAGALFLGLKQPRREGDHSPPCSAEVKKGGAIPLLPHMS
jgi:hypothetical protein